MCGYALHFYYARRAGRLQEAIANQPRLSCTLSPAILRGVLFAQVLDIMRRLLLLFTILLVSCSTDAPGSLTYADLPDEGDPVRGEQIFHDDSRVVAICSACHTETAAASPVLAGFGEVAASRVEGQSAREYAFYSIVEPGRHIVEGYGNAMPNTYDEQLSAQDIADLIAYLLTL